MSSLSEQPDQVGLETLKRFSGAEDFNRWMHDRISSYCKGSILEIGSGIGNISDFLLENTSSLTLSDLRPQYCNILKNKYQRYSKIKGIFQIDLTANAFVEAHKGLLDKFDTVVALNVVEHIDNDLLAIRNCSRLLRANGNLVVLVPALPALYNSLDRALGHFRRYRKPQLISLFEKNNIATTHTEYFNAVGIAGWWFTGSLQNRKMISASQLRLYDRLVPAFRFFDRLIMKSAGLSIIAVGRKQDV